MLSPGHSQEEVTLERITLDLKVLLEATRARRET